MRLIDVDELKEHKFVSINCYLKSNCDNGFSQYKQGWNDAIDAIIDNAPTVEKPTGEWIPVSERLPDDMQRVLIWFEYYRYGDYNCMYQTYGFGYVCGGKWSPFINGETGWQDARIIAWQPLPEPYKEVSNDHP